MNGTEGDVFECQYCGSVTVSDSPSDRYDGELTSAETAPAKGPELAVVLREVFGISETGTTICVYLVEDGESTAGDVADINREKVKALARADRGDSGTTGIYLDE